MENTEHVASIVIPIIYDQTIRRFNGYEKAAKLMLIGTSLECYCSVKALKDLRRDITKMLEAMEMDE